MWKESGIVIYISYSLLLYYNSLFTHMKRIYSHMRYGNCVHSPTGALWKRKVSDRLNKWQSAHAEEENIIIDRCTDIDEFEDRELDFRMNNYVDPQKKPGPLMINT